MTDTLLAPTIGQYAIDTAQSSIEFTTRHLFGLLPVRGRFTIAAGTIEVTAPDAAGAVHAEIDAASFHTGSRARDTAVRSARFLDTQRWPQMHFAGERYDRGQLAGQLTVRDRTRPVTLDIATIRPLDDGFTATATATVDRFEFGVTASRGMAGRRLHLTVTVRTHRTG